MRIERPDAPVASRSRRTFLKGAAAGSLGLLTHPLHGLAISNSARESAARLGKAITLLNDGGFESSHWGWQFTAGASVHRNAFRGAQGAVRIETSSGDYARFLVFGPEAGKTYTLAGWVKTQNIVPQEEDAGAYFGATQFEFQGRPTEFTIDGKQLPERRFGNFSGDQGWRRFSRSFVCLLTTTWFEVVIGIYRASGTAWFSGLTFVEGDQPADLESVIDIWQAAQQAHEDCLKGGQRTKAAAAVFRDNIPVRGTASDPQRIARALQESHDVTFLSADQLADSKRLNRDHFDMLVLPYGESFPLPARPAVEEFLMDGGDLLTMGGYAFQSPLVRRNERWEFLDLAVQQESTPNLLPPIEMRHDGWKPSGDEYTSLDAADLPEPGGSRALKLAVPPNLWNQDAGWSFDLPIDAETDQYFFEAWVRAAEIQPRPDGSGYIAIQQLDDKGVPVPQFGTFTLERIQGSSEWHRVHLLMPIAPGCHRLRVSCGIRNATGTLWGTAFRLERRSRQASMNTATGYPLDEWLMNTGTSHPIGMFDADFRLKRAVTIRPAEGQTVLGNDEELAGDFEGYAASCVLGMNNSRWIPLLQAHDGLGRKRGAAGSLVHHVRGPFARSSWAFFGVDNQDIFAGQFGTQTLRSVGQALACKCFLHGCESEFACYRHGESVRLHLLASNYSRHSSLLELRWTISPAGRSQPVFSASRRVQLLAGQTLDIATDWQSASFASSQYRVTAQLFLSDREVDRIETGFAIWDEAALKKGLAFEFKENYFHLDGQSVFLQGTDDYAHTFVDQEENPLTWSEDAQGCRDSCIDVYENLLGLRGPQHRPTKAWWRWVDAMTLNVQQSGGLFFPGLLVFANTAVSDRDMADQAAYVRAFAARYRNVAGLIYYLNGDLELHDPNLPDLQRLYNQYLRTKYGTDEELRTAWALSPPESPIGSLTIRPGQSDWSDVRTLDDFEFRTQVVRRWLNRMYDAIRVADKAHPVTAEFYQLPLAGIDLLTALGQLELANFGYFDGEDDDYDRFPQICRLLDQSIRGKGINVGEFGVKTHPAFQHIGGRTELYEQQYFLGISHYSFALGASKIQNWSWKYPADLPFEWGINYPNELIPRDVRACYRNCGLLFRILRPRYKVSDVVCLLPGANRKGGQAARILRGLTNAIRLLIDQRIAFHTLPDEFLESLPPNIKTIFYPLPYCPSDEIVRYLTRFVENGGQLYVSGDISYDSIRRHNRTDRLKDLCGVDFVSRIYPNIAYDKAALPTAPGDSDWPAYMAAPGIVTRLAGATLLLEGRDGTPIVTEYRLGTGKVVFSADPIELHGDPRYHSYAHSFYGQLVKRFHLTGAKVDPADGPIHCFDVPSQDDRTITLLVNHDARATLENVVVPSVAGEVHIRLAPRMPGIAVATMDKGVCAIESSGDAWAGDELLIGCNFHFMAISFSHASLRASTRLLLLPVGEGEMRIPEASRWQNPRLAIGEIVGGRWKEYENFRPEREAEMLRIHVDANRALSMFILCESAEYGQSVQEMETWVTSPWKVRG